MDAGSGKHAELSALKILITRAYRQSAQAP